MVLLTEHDLIIRRALVAAQGREVKHTGDGIMAVVRRRGERAAMLDRRSRPASSARTAGGPDPELRVRIGIAAGEPVDHNDDLFGSTVTLASRLCAAAEAGHILVSELVRDLGSGEGFAFEPAGERLLRGFPTPTPVFELSRAPG